MVPQNYLELQIKPFIFLILLVSFLSLNIIYGKTNENIGSKREVRSFKGMLISYMVYTAVDFRLIIGDAFYTAFPRLIVMFIISAGFAAMSFSCFFWFLHVRASMHLKFRIKQRNVVNFWNILVHTPLFCVLIILFTPLHVIVYELTETTVVFKPALMFILLMDYVYLIAATGISIYNRKNAKTKSEKKKYNSQIIFILFFTISGLLIAFLLNLPAIELCIIPVVLKLLLEQQDSQIYTDALTKLYNRRRMTDFITEEIETCSEKKPLTVILVDLDYFKSINDILGHDEGDKALVSFSQSLKNIVAPINAFAARWGGDEFVVAGKDQELPEKFREWLRESLENNNKLNYIPEFSVGITKCTSQDMTCEQLIIKADTELYKDKNERHKTSNSFVKRLREVKSRADI
ncbi:GGDEF domain-containing protein [Butyrivibrio sp. AE3004]|uniref:GGDEF domain-containing protein n=1 Tax=Butyrivibrio sp. AE3004 TaxID=1506994 RepID=UPI000494C0E7|nr:GGDEF domain-containing protein [Butyrivibrio sp. AE3004]